MSEHNLGQSVTASIDRLFCVTPVPKKDAEPETRVDRESHQNGEWQNWGRTDAFLFSRVLTCLHTSEFREPISTYLLPFRPSGLPHTFPADGLAGGVVATAAGAAACGAAPVGLSLPRAVRGYAIDALVCKSRRATESAHPVPPLGPAPPHAFPSGWRLRARGEEYKSCAASLAPASTAAISEPHASCPAVPVV